MPAFFCEWQCNGMSRNVTSVPHHRIFHLAVTTRGCVCIGAPTRRHFASGWSRATQLAGCFAPVKMQGGWVDSKISLSQTNLSPNTHTHTNLTFCAKAPNNISLYVSAFFIIKLANRPDVSSLEIRMQERHACMPFSVEWQSNGMSRIVTSVPHHTTDLWSRI